MPQQKSKIDQKTSKSNKLEKNDFIEIEFIAKVKDTKGVFDTNIADELKKLNPEYNKEQAKPYIFPLGHKMFLKGIEEFLIGKDISKEKKYTIELSPENAFGSRDPKLITRIPIKIFMEQKINPVPGIMFNFDGRLGKVLTVSGGRVIVDFNNPVAGRDVIYDIKILREITNINEKVKALMGFLFKKEFPFKVNEKGKKIIIEADEGIRAYLETFKDKFKEILDLDLEVREVKGVKGEIKGVKEDVKELKQIKEYVKK